jgi:hypothetical protein
VRAALSARTPSNTQVQFLQDGHLAKFAAEHRARGMRCVFVHVVNPYGMAWHRRWNENNVDLNRNFMARRVSSLVLLACCVARPSSALCLAIRRLRMAAARDACCCAASSPFLMHCACLQTKENGHASVPPNDSFDDFKDFLYPGSKSTSSLGCCDCFGMQSCCYITQVGTPLLSDRSRCAWFDACAPQSFVFTDG